MYALSFFLAGGGLIAGKLFGRKILFACFAAILFMAVYVLIQYAQIP